MTSTITFDVDAKTLFLSLYNASTETEVDEVLLNNSSTLENPDNWKPLGGNASNFSIVKNQQSNPIAALIEKITNSIDALLTKKCYEAGIEPNSEEAPKSMREALEKFYPGYKDWGQLKTIRKRQAEEIQVLADGPVRKTAVIFYDNGEGQHPKKFEDTFLSLIKGNKNNILFVQGKYNMGGSGGIVFCGKRRYQLIASRRYDKTGDYGFTLIREHKKKQSDMAKETWFEYLTINGDIPSFSSNPMDLGLENRKFETGTIIKLYNYHFPSGYSAFSQDLNQSINEYLFEPALPILTQDNAVRYPKNTVLVNTAYGLSRRLLSEEKDYLEDRFSETFEDPIIGQLKVSCFIFKRKAKDFDAKKTKETIADRYFKNRMSVLFTLNGQVHGHYTSEFITRSLKMNLLKNYLLIHVDCTNVKYSFRKELFMASRDRLKEGEETQYLRKFLSTQLSKSGSRLKEIERKRKQAVNVDSSLDTKDLIKSLSNEMPLDSELMKLLSQTFKLDKFDSKSSKKKKPQQSKQKHEQEETKFRPKRFPSFLKLDKKVGKNGETVIQIPRGGEKRLTLHTDVENDYLDRLDEPGDLQVTIMGPEEDLESSNKKQREKPSKTNSTIHVSKSSPSEGKIRITLGAPDEMNVGEKRKVDISLSSPEGPFQEIFFVRIGEKRHVNPKIHVDENKPELLGLPTLVLAYKAKSESTQASWEEVEVATGQDMNYADAICLAASGDTLEKIYVNMDCSVLKDFKGKYRNPNPEQVELTNKKFYTSVYFHVLFLYTITVSRKFRVTNDSGDDIDVATYLKDIFGSFYASFILNFGTEILLESIAE